MDEGRILREKRDPKDPGGKNIGSEGSVGSSNDPKEKIEDPKDPGRKTGSHRSIETYHEYLGSRFFFVSGSLGSCFFLFQDP